MLCTRCSHPLKPRADRCLRCFALNPQNCAQEPRPASPAAPEPLPRSLRIDSEPPEARPAAGRIDFRIIDSTPPSAYRVSEDLPKAALDARLEGCLRGRGSARGQGPGPQLGLSLPPRTAEPDFADATEAPAFPEEPISLSGAGTPAPAASAAATCEDGHSLPSASPPAAAAEPPLRVPVAARGAASLSLPAFPARLVAWMLDAAIVLACAALHVGVAAALLGPKALASGGPQPLDLWADLLLSGSRLPLLWALLAFAVAVAYSWIFISLGGQTPGMWLGGLRLVRAGGIPGGQVSAPRALARSLLALPSLLLGGFGFVLALVDARGQTLHDKLAGCLVVDELSPPSSPPRPLRVPAHRV